MKNNERKSNARVVKQKNSFNKKIPCWKSSGFWLGIGLILLLGLAIILLSYFNNNLGLTGKVIDPNNLEDPLGIGLNPDNMPESPEDLANISREYLIKEWKIVAEKSPYLSPILKVINPVLKIFCGYEFSPFIEFFVAFFVALVLLAFFTNGINVFYRNFLVSLVIGFLINVIAVAGGVMKIVVPKIVFLFNNKWIIISFFVACALLIWLFDFLRKYINKRREKNVLNNLVDGKDAKGVNLEDVKETLEGAKAMKEGFDNSKDTSTWD
jgi:hypothetical protein